MDALFSRSPIRDISGGKYEDRLFVGNFILRQYPERVRVAGEFRQLGGSINRRYYTKLGGFASTFMRPGGISIDIGCGAGRLCVELARRGADIVLGVDKSVRMIEACSAIVCASNNEFGFEFSASKTGTNSGSIPSYGLQNCLFSVMRAEALACCDASVDFLICANVLHRVKDPSRLLLEIRRVLKPGGRALMTNNYDWQSAFTPEACWLSELDVATAFGDWPVLFKEDNIPYLAYLYHRKYIISLNEVIVYEKPK